uniref:ArgE/DapE family deacylase n=1 Tax=Fervidicoccus fontis TaxID=683846 RepID=A0A7J3ZIQ6_9CREN
MDLGEELKREGLDLLLQLISIPSISPSGEHYEEIVSALREFFEKHSIDVEVFRVPEEYQKRNCKQAGSLPRYIVRALVEGEERPWLQLNGHYDVVPGGPGWTKTDPFTPLVVGDLVYGRGATDMKGGLTSMALSLVLYSQQKKRPTTLDAVFVPDEEIGGECGTGYYLHLLGDNLPDCAIIAEPSSPNYIYVGHRGGLWLKVRIKGRTAHGSTPWAGVNAFINMAKLVVWLEENYVKGLSYVKSKYEYDIPNANSPTAMIGGEAGVPQGKANQVPGEAFFTIDRRLVVEEKLEDVEEELRQTIIEAARRLGIEEDNIEITITSRVKPAIVPPGNVLSRAITARAQQLGLPKPREVVSVGGLDLRYYTERGVLVVSYGPGVHKASHSPDEYVSFKEVLKFAEIYSKLPFELSKLTQRE